jgi:carotenoid cleavage dioxygenase-like enzyme
MATREPSYMHSFAVTERHLLLIENPLVVNPVRLIAELTVKAGSFITQYRWKPELGLRIHAFDLESGELAQHWTADPCFLFHTINAYESGGEIRLDVCAFEDASIIDALRTERLLDGSDAFSLNLPSPTRFTLPLSGGDVSQRALSEETDLELPRINYSRCNGRPYRYAYGNAAHGAAFLKNIVKLDVESGEHHSWSEPDQWAGEPVFVARPGGQAEDDGVLLSVVLDSNTAGSYLLILDASDLSELARARAPHRVPLGFHGQFFS